MACPPLDRDIGTHGTAVKPITTYSDYFTLITGIAWASVIFNEVPNFWFVLALIAMLAGLVMVNAGTRASRKAAGSAEDAAES